jgi:integrase
VLARPSRTYELEALTPADVDLEHHTITIAKQADPKSKGRKGTKQTKTKRVRTVDIEAHLLPLVVALVKRPQGKRGRLLRMPPPEDRAELLRKDLRTVGVRRPALFIEGDPLQRAITFHDLRDTGLTHMAVRGDSPTVIQWTGGHTDFKTTQGYIARGQTERRRVGEPLPPLPSGLFPEPTEPPPRIVPDDSRCSKFAFSLAKFATPTGIEPVLPT